jgi:hypothetical protein
MTATDTNVRMCAYHAGHGRESVHPDAADWARLMIIAKRRDDPEDQFLDWEAIYGQFEDCDVCMHEQLNILSAVVVVLEEMGYLPF